MKNIDDIKILVVSYSPFSKTMNNGKTLSSFFQGFNCEQIAQFSFCNGDYNEEVCNNYYFLTNKDVLKGKFGFSFSLNISKKNDNKLEEKRGLFKIFNYFSSKRNPLSIFIKNNIWKKAKYIKVYEWIKNYDPDIVFFQGFSMSYGYKFVLNVCEKFNLPLILELTDDYTYRLYPFSLIDKYNHIDYMKHFTKTLNIAKKVIVISEEMRDEYKERFNVSSEVLMNASESSFPNEEYQKNNREYIYAGNLLLNRWKVLLNLGMALKKRNLNEKLLIYTPDVPHKKILNKLNKIDTITYGGILSKKDLEEKLKRSGFVVHVEAFDKKNKKITRLSISTKISEYLLCGSKIIAIGPEDIASMNCIKKYNLGICINDYTVDKIMEGLDCKLDINKNILGAKIFIEKCASNKDGAKIKEIIKDSLKR